MKRQRIMAVGCSHGDFIDGIASDGVLEFRRRFKPDVVVHLGDAWDFACLRSGARGNSEDIDRARDPQSDIDHGAAFIRQLRPTHFLFGNHEARIVDLAKHWCARTSKLARDVYAEITDPLKEVGAVWHDQWDLRQFYKFGDYKFLHGTLFGANYLRDTARAVGNCVVAHAHRPGIQTADRDDGARAYSPGCLRTVESASYAKARACTLSWGHGVVWGEFDPKRAYLWLHQPTPYEAAHGWTAFPV